MLEAILQFQPPLWVTSIVVFLYVVALLEFHVGTPAWAKAIMAIPPLCLLAIYGIFFFFDVPVEIRLFFGRHSLNLLFMWHIVALFFTRKLHVRPK